GGVPNGVAATANKIWTGDAFTTTVFSIDRKTFAADASAPVAVDCTKSKFSYVADVMTIRGELYRLDPDSGAIKSHTTVGPNPTELAGLDDGRIVVANAGDNTLTVLTV